MLGRLDLTTKVVSKNLEMPEKEVSNVMNFVYKELARELQECNYPFIYVRDLGTFIIKRRAVNKRLWRLYWARRRWKKSPLNHKDKTVKTIEDELFKYFRVRRMVKKAKQVIDDHKR